MSAAQDLAFMHEALALARQGRHSTSPNPAVGCVLVRDGAVIARGYHERAGAAHAEVRALRDAGAMARGATAYVSLEPCNHHGRTGPCSEALIEAGVARVVYACDDPNPDVAGQGAARLRAAGISVVAGVAAAEARALNRGFFKRMRSARPWVRVKLAMSLDARVALASGESQWITGAAARAEVQRLRAEACAVVTGSGTVLADDPALTVRDPAFAMGGRQPRRVIVDRRLRTPSAARLFALPGETRVLTESDDAERLASLRAAGAVVDCFACGALAPDAVLAHLAPLGVNEVLVEAGPTLAGAFLVAGVCDELVVHLAPKLLGLAARTAFEMPSPTRLGEAFALKLVSSTAVGDDIALVFIPRSASRE